jgi:hypothetical protein
MRPDTVADREACNATVRPLHAWFRTPRGLPHLQGGQTIAGFAQSYIRSLPLPRRKEIGRVSQ